MISADPETRSLQDQLCGFLVGALHDWLLDVEWHHDGQEFLTSFTVTNRANNASVVVHIDPAGA
jgi:hypothetical protein